MNIGKGLFLLLNSLNPVRYKATKCGHRTKRKGKVSAFGHTIITEMPKNDKGSVDYCLACIGKMAIRCAWCCNPIFIGDAVTLYTPRGNFHVPEHAVVYNENPLQLVGCLGWNCADTGADRAGFWLPDGNGNARVRRVPTAFEAISGAKEPSMAVVDDVSDVNKAENPKLIPLKDQNKT